MKILFIGLGGIGQRHARNLRSILGGNAELLAYRTRRLSHLITPTLGIDETRNPESEYGIRVFDDLNAALAEGPEVAFICNPSGLHVDVALQCVDAGCDIFVEKPLSNSLAGVESLIQLARKKSLVAMVGYQLRFHPCLKQLSSVLKQAGIGQVLAVRAIIGEYLPFWHRYEDYRGMYAARADLGGGVVLSQIHEMDYLYSLFGVPRRVFAMGGHWSELDIDVEDTASVLMEFSWGGRPLPVHLQLDYLQYPPTRQCEVVGDNGKITADFVTNEVLVYRDRNPVPERCKYDGFERNQLFLDELAHFLNCVKTRQQPMITLEDGLQSLRIALAAKESIASRRVVEIEQAPRV